MKKITLLALSFCLPFLGISQLTSPPGGGNQKSVVTQYMGLTHVTITYNSPDVTGPNGQSRKGQIWGNLVPYGMANLQFGLSSAENPSPWRAGANENTTIEFSHDMTVQGYPIKAGTYGLHMIPGQEEWVIIFSDNSTAWGSYFYKEEEDALRVTVTPKECEFHEWLTFEFDNRQLDECMASLKWENLEIPFNIAVPSINKIYAASMDRELQNRAGFNWQGWNTAANYYLNNELDLNTALDYANKAIGWQRNYNTLATKAAILDAQGKDKEAMEAFKQAIEHNSANVFQIHNLARGYITSGKNEMALKLFEMNAKRFPKTWPVNLGLARGYSANGEYKKALKYAKKALKNAPNKLNKDNITASIDKLEKGQDIN